jgi:membrane protein DedA with SNARE-associated domain
MTTIIWIALFITELVFFATNPAAANALAWSIGETILGGALVLPFFMISYTYSKRRRRQ